MGRKKIKAMNEEWEYEGEIDESGKACGIGKASYRSNSHIWKGSFLNDTFEGIGTYNLNTVEL